MNFIDRYVIGGWNYECSKCHKKFNNPDACIIHEGMCNGRWNQPKRTCGKCIYFNGTDCGIRNIWTREACNDWKPKNGKASLAGPAKSKTSGQFQPLSAISQNMPSRSADLDAIRKKFEEKSWCGRRVPDDIDPSKGSVALNEDDWDKMFANIAELIAEKDFLLMASSGAISKFGKNNAKLGEEIARLKKENERLIEEMNYQAGCYLD